MRTLSQRESGWRISISGTLRGIYLIRYFLFSGGAAIAGALLQRAIFQSERPLLGLLIGLLVGLVAFQSQLRQASVPWLALSQDALYLIGRRHFIVLPWSAIHNVTQEAGQVTMHTPEGTPGEPARRELVLRSRTLGVSTRELHTTLREICEDPTRRAYLPADSQVREQISRRSSR